MPKILVLYHSTYGHVEAMAEAVAEGARSVEGAVVDIKRVEELVPEELARKSGYKLDQAAPIAKVDDLAGYDAVIVGSGSAEPRPTLSATFKMSHTWPISSSDRAPPNLLRKSVQICVPA